MHRNIEEQLAFADLDCTCVALSFTPSSAHARVFRALAYDGEQVFAMPRTVRALNTRTNFVPPTRLRRITTPGRIVKYCQRGFSSLLFGACTWLRGSTNVACRDLQAHAALRCRGAQSETVFLLVLIARSWSRAD